MNDACDTIIRALNPRGGRKDDVALLMARLNGIPDGDVAEWQLALDPREVARARRLVHGRLLDWGLPDAVETAELMVSELVTNAVHHARSHHVGLRLVRTDALLCEVQDDEAGPGDPAECEQGGRVRPGTAGGEQSRPGVGDKQHAARQDGVVRAGAGPKGACAPGEPVKDVPGPLPGERSDR